MKLGLRVLFLLLSLGLLAFGILRERHAIHPLGPGEPQAVSGPRFVEGTTFDSYMLKDGRIFDIYSLSQSTANEKDCKT